MSSALLHFARSTFHTGFGGAYFGHRNRTSSWKYKCSPDVCRYNNQGFFDPISQICAVLQLAIIYSFILAIVIKNKRSVSTPGVNKPVAEGPKVTPCPQGDKQQDTKMPRQALSFVPGSIALFLILPFPSSVLW